VTSEQVENATSPIWTARR